MAIFDSAVELANYLNARAIECRVEDDFVVLPDPDSGLTATIVLRGGWLVFKAFIADWEPKLESVALANLLLIQDRLIGFRFSVTEDGLSALQDFPIDMLTDDFHNYIDHAFYVIGAIMPTLHSHLAGGIAMSNDDIDAMFDQMDPSQVH